MYVFSGSSYTPVTGMFSSVVSGGPSGLLFSNRTFVYDSHYTNKY